MSFAKNITSFNQLKKLMCDLPFSLYRQLAVIFQLLWAANSSSWGEKPRENVCVTTVKAEMTQWRCKFQGCMLDVLCKLWIGTWEKEFRCYCKRPMTSLSCSKCCRRRALFAYAWKRSGTVDMRYGKCGVNGKLRPPAYQNWPVLIRNLSQVRFRWCWISRIWPNVWGKLWASI